MCDRVLEEDDGRHSHQEETCIILLCVYRVRDAMALELKGSISGIAAVRTPNLVGDVLGVARTPRWLGDPYGVDEHGTRIMGPDRVSLPNIVAKSRCVKVSSTTSHC